MTGEFIDQLCQTRAQELKGLCERTLNSMPESIVGFNLEAVYDDGLRIEAEVSRIQASESELRGHGFTEEQVRHVLAVQRMMAIARGEIKAPNRRHRIAIGICEFGGKATGWIAGHLQLGGVKVFSWIARLIAGGDL